MATLIVVFLAIALTVFFLRKRFSQISVKDARAQWKNGALLVDVRTAAEFNFGHLPNAINVPLEEIDLRLPTDVIDKNRVLLLHCQTGRRSSMAQKKLIRLGYSNVFSLGSYGRAEKIVTPE